MATKKKAGKPAKKQVVKKSPAVKKPVAKKPAAKKPSKPVSAPKKQAVKKVIAKVAVKKPELKKTVHTHSNSVAKPPDKKVEAPKASEVKKPGIKLISAPPVPVKKKSEPTKPTKVVMPEIKTKTSRKYEPEFTKSILDQPEHIQTGPTMRYSDADLGEFRELIQKKLDQAKKELAYLQGLITRKDEMGGDETENRYMTMEDGSMSMEREQLAQMASRQINYIDHLEKALMRIENKTYGICRVTGKLIDKARLRAVPHATLSIEAKQMMNK